MPPNMAEWLPPDHLAWFVMEVVDQLDTSAFHASRRTGGVGRQGYDPDMLLGLLVYAYAVGERSSRRIERLCVDHVAFRVLCGQDAPDHTTIARFRAEHAGAFAEVFGQLLRLCAAAGMVKVGTVSIDGTKIAANAARGANRSPRAVREEAQRIAREILAQAAATDVAEDHAAAGRPGRDDQLPPGYGPGSSRAGNIAKALAELDRQDAAEATADAADRARIAEQQAAMAAGEVMRPGPPPAGVDPVAWTRARISGLNTLLAALDGVPGPPASRQRAELRRRLTQAQATLAAAEHAAHHDGVDLRGSAQRHRDRRTAKARARGGTGPVVNTTDPDSRLMCDATGGSVQAYNAQIAVTDDHLIVGVHLSQDANDTGCYTPTLDQATLHAATLGKTIGLVLADAGYFTDANLTAPGPDRLIAPGKNSEVFAHLDPDPTSPPAQATPAELMQHRLTNPANAARYKRRSATVEPVIAHLKDRVGLRRFARRGLHAVTAELHLAATAVNLNRLHQAALGTS